MAEVERSFEENTRIYVGFGDERRKEKESEQPLDNSSHANKFDNGSRESIWFLDFLSSSGVASLAETIAGRLKDGRTAEALLVEAGLWDVVKS